MSQHSAQYQFKQRVQAIGHAALQGALPPEQIAGLVFSICSILYARPSSAPALTTWLSGSRRLPKEIALVLSYGA